MKRKPVVKPFFTYFGGKYRAAHRYPTPEHPTIIEPFAGSAGYSIRHPERKVILNDLDEKVAGTWDYLIHVSEDEIRALPLYDGSWATVADLNIHQEARWLIGWWLNKGANSPRNMPSAWMRGGKRPNSYWGETIRERIASQLQHIRHWEIRNESYENLPEIAGTWYVDPPYEVAGRSYREKGIDYEMLAGWCKSRPGQTIVCENEGAKWLPFSFLGDTKATPGKERVGVSAEAIWTSTTANSNESGSDEA